ncbi:MAG: hypothetical protein Q8Q49_00885 [bacterium]|nr:hypothetical protein [bacterium]
MEEKNATKKIEPEEKIMHDLLPKEEFDMKKVAIILVVVAILGVGTGFVLAKSGGGGILPGGASSSTAGGVQKGKIYGSNDTKTFKDTAEGVLKDGGIDGEGQYHLERPGGVSQNVYMTSSLVDLSEFKGKKVKVWGETQAARKAGWLMDVGRVEVL